jgi:AcrR family transcriptional regulator
MAHGQLYRYFPSREALLRALADSAAREIQDRIGEAIARITCGLIATGSKYIALAYLWPKPADAADPQVSEPLLQLFRRGVEDGTLRGDLPAETLLGSYADLIEGSIIRSARAHTGVEETSAAVLSIFLSGALGSRVTPARA